MKKEQPRIVADHFERGPGPVRQDLLHASVTREVVGAFYTVYNELRYGFLESVYRDALVLELGFRGVKAETEAVIAVRYKQKQVGHFRADVLVESRVVVEVKACATVGAPDRQQLLNYLRGTGLEVGLLLHFGPRPSFARMVMSEELQRILSHPRRSAASPLRGDPRPRFPTSGRSDAE